MRPSEVFKLYLSGKVNTDKDSYQYGMLAMALEIVTVIKTLEALPVTSVGTREESISVLHTLLQETGLDIYAYEWYERLDDWRRPKFVPDAELPHSGPSAEQLPPMSTSRASLLASQLLAEQETAYTDVPSGSDQTMDPPLDESDERAAEEDGAKLDG